MDGASFAMEPGEALGIVGESGSGKTSLAAALIRMLPANVARYEGSVLMDGADLMTLSNEEFRRAVRWKKLSMAFQGAMNALNPVLRVGSQIGETALLEGVPKSEVKRKVQGLLERVGLSPEVAQRYPHELSGGMKQRVVIAMALVQDPALVILDEPTSALDVSVQAQITEPPEAAQGGAGALADLHHARHRPGQRHLRPHRGGVRGAGGGAGGHRGGAGESAAPLYGEAAGQPAATALGTCSRSSYRERRQTWQIRRRGAGFSRDAPTPSTDARRTLRCCRWVWATQRGAGLRLAGS